MAHAIETKSLLVLAHGKNSVLNGDVFSREHEVDAGMSGGARSVDCFYASMGMRRTKKLAVRHPRQKNVVSEARLSGYLRAGIDSAPRDTNDAKIVTDVFGCVYWRLSRILFDRHASSS